MEVRKANDKKVSSVKEDVKMVDEIGIEKDVTIENLSEQFFNQMDDFELEFTLNNKYETLTEEQKKALISIIKKRKELENFQKSEKTDEKIDLKPKIRVLKLKTEYNGFASVLFLSLLTSIYGAFFIFYILLSNGLLK